MLSYDICRKLKEAGYPQDHTAAKFMCFQRADGSWTPALFADEYAFSTDIDWAACPNSDELIAAMQVRWPFVAVAVSASTTQQLADDNETVISMTTHCWEAWDVYDEGCDPHTGNSPADALAALYLALAGVTPC